jgi:hypothetical protein
VDEDSGLQDGFGEVCVVHIQGRERDEQVKPRRDALHADAGQLLAQGAEQGVTPVPLPLADLADVLFELAAGDEPGEDQLGQRGTAQVGGVLGVNQVRA